MPSRYPAPGEQDVEAVLATLVSAPARVTRVPSPDPDREPVGVIAEYVTDSDSLAAIAFADHGAVNFVGGALAVVDAEALQELDAATNLHDAALERFRDVLSGLESQLNSDYTPPVRYAKLHPLPGELGEEIKQLWRSPRAKRGYRVTVDDYGSGALILYLS